MNQYITLLQNNKFLESSIPEVLAPAFITSEIHTIAEQVFDIKLISLKSSLKGKLFIVTVDIFTFGATTVFFKILNLSAKTNMVISFSSGIFLRVSRIAFPFILKRKLPANVPPNPILAAPLALLPPDPTHFVFQNFVRVNLGFIPRHVNPHNEVDGALHQLILSRPVRVENNLEEIRRPRQRNTLEEIYELFPKRDIFDYSESKHQPIPVPVNGNHVEIRQILPPRNPDHPQFNEEFISYCQRHAPHFNQDRIFALVRIGEQFASRLHQGDALEKNVPEVLKEYPELLEELLGGFFWYLMNLASQKKQTYVEGSFSIADPTGSIFKFLNTFKPITYNRKCSHLYTLRDDIIGFDMEQHRFLTAEMGHLLFVSFKNRGESWVLVKPEPHGFDPFNKPGEAVGHAWQFFLTAGKKFAPSVFGSDHGDGKHKERVPVAIIGRYIALASNKKGFGKVIDDVGNHWGYGRGLQAIYDHLVELGNDDLSISEFREDLEKKYDHLKYRIGDEVIFLLNEW